MKRVIILILSLLLLLGGCYREEPIDKPVVFYFLPMEPMAEEDFHHDVPYIRPEVRDGSLLGSSVVSILSTYLRGPSADSNLRSPFPSGSYLYTFSHDGNQLQITMEGAFTELTGLDLSIACACLSKTAMELTGASTVYIYAKDGLLDGAEYVLMDATSIELLDAYQNESE